MNKVWAKLVLKKLTPDQIYVQQQVCSNFLAMFGEEPELMDTCDKT